MATEDQDLIEHLTSEHRQLEQMWARLLLYPALERLGDVEMSDHGKEEHAEIRRFLDEVDGKDPADEAIFTTFTEIIMSVDAHVADEEDSMFPKLRAGLSSEELLDLGRKSEKAEAVAPTHPHPTTPDGKVGATVVGGMAGIVDKARDKITGR